MNEYHNMIYDYSGIPAEARRNGQDYKTASLLPSFELLYDSYRPAESSENFLEDFIQEKLGLVKDIIIDIKLQVEERKNVQRKIIDSLDQLICVTRTKLLDLVNKHETRISQEFMRRRSELDKMINQLETQKLTEKLEFWRDVNMLKKDLREALEKHQSSLSFQTINSI